MAGDDLIPDYRPRLLARLDRPIGCVGAGFSPAAIAARDPAKAVADRHAIPAARNIDDLLADEAVEVLDVAVPPGPRPDQNRPPTRT